MKSVFEKSYNEASINFSTELGNQQYQSNEEIGFNTNSFNSKEQNFEEGGNNFESFGWNNNEVQRGFEQTAGWPMQQENELVAQEQGMNEQYPVFDEKQFGGPQAEESQQFGAQQSQFRAEANQVDKEQLYLFETKSPEVEKKMLDRQKDEIEGYLAKKTKLSIYYGLAPYMSNE